MPAATIHQKMQLALAQELRADRPLGPCAKLIKRVLEANESEAGTDFAREPDLDDPAQAEAHRAMEAIRRAFEREFGVDNSWPNVTLVVSYPPDGRIGVATTEPEPVYALEALKAGWGTRAPRLPTAGRAAVTESGEMVPKEYVTQALAAGAELAQRVRDANQSERRRLEARIAQLRAEVERLAEGARRGDGGDRAASPMTSDYYQRTLRWGRGWMIVEGPSPYIQLLFRSKLLHEHGMFMLGLQTKYGERWHWWQLKPPMRSWTIRFEDPPTPVEEVAAWALTAVAIWRMVR